MPTIRQEFEGKHGLSGHQSCTSTSFIVHMEYVKYIVKNSFINKIEIRSDGNRYFATKIFSKKFTMMITWATKSRSHRSWWYLLLKLSRFKDLRYIYFSSIPTIWWCNDQCHKNYCCRAPHTEIELSGLRLSYPWSLLCRPLYKIILIEGSSYRSAAEGLLYPLQLY